MTPEEKKAVLKEYKEPDEIRDKVRLKIAENRHAYVRYCEAIQKKNVKNGNTTLARREREKTPQDEPIQPIEQETPGRRGYKEIARALDSFIEVEEERDNEK